MRINCRNLSGHFVAWGIAALFLGGGGAGLAAQTNDLLRLKEQVVRLQEQSKWLEAMPLVERLVSETAKLHGEVHTNTADALQIWAWLALQNGDYERAEPLWRRALTIDEKIFGTNSLGTVRRLHMLAALYSDLGDAQKAMSLLQRAISIREKCYGPNHVETGQVIATLGKLYSRAGDFARAEASYRRAEAIFEKSGRYALKQLSGVRSSLAWLYWTIGDDEKAEQMALRAFQLRKEIHGEEHAWMASSLRELATVYRARGEFAKAEQRLNEALAMMEKLFGTEHLLVSELLDDLGRIYLEQGALEKAEAALTRARRIIEQSVGGEHLRAASVLMASSRLSESRGDYAVAQDLCRRAHELRERRLGPVHYLTADSLFQLAHLEAALGHPERALAHADALQRAEESFRADVFSFTSERQRLVSRRNSSRVSHGWDLWADLGATGPLARAVFRAKGVVLDSFMEDRLLTESGQDTESRELISRLMRARHRLGQLTSIVSVEACETNRYSETQSVQDEVDSLEGLLARRVSGYGKVRRALLVEPAQIIAAIPEKAVLLEAVRYRHYLGRARWQDNYGILVLSRRTEPQWVGLGPADVIEKSIKLSQHAVRTPGANEALVDALHEMCELIWVPVQSRLPAGCNAIIISPDGELNFISFAALLTSSNRFLGEDFSFSYVSSGRDLLVRENRPPKNSQLLIWANPDFGKAPAPITGDVSTGSPSPEHRWGELAFRALAGSQREGELLRDRAPEFGFEEAVLHASAEATEAELRRTRSPKVLHLATHGFVLPQLRDSAGAADSGGWNGALLPKLNPMSRSGLALAGAQHTLRAWAEGKDVPSQDDGIVTADEISGLDLHGTWLVVLSACDTGTGEALAGEGVLGLRRGFIQAGARNLLLTLWPIGDEATAGIIPDLYADLRKSGSPARALAHVQRKALGTLRLEKGAAAACRAAGPFILSFQGTPE